MKIIKATSLAIIALLHNLANAYETFNPNTQPVGYLQPMALSTFDLKNGGKGYRPWFENGAWQGDLIEYDISSSGQVSTSIDLSTATPTNYGTNWSARLMFNAAEALNPNYWDTERKIITYNGTNQVAFRWNNLSAEQKNEIDLSQAQAFATSSPILNFIRGDRSNESPNGNYRKRYNLLGDIIHSNPVYVGAPNRNYTDSAYVQFQQDNLNRAPRIYVGANDGMLHVFDAATGKEVYAFIPPTVIRKLDNLVAYPYFHEYYVDGSISVSDVKINDQWRTVLYGGLGAGGKERFALDITDPNLTAESSNLGNDKKVLWVQTAELDSDLGDAYGQGSFVKLDDNKFYIVNGNGYNSTNGQAILTITDVETGIIQKINTLSGGVDSPNGLSTPALVDVDRDQVFDYAYAGDLQGNLWKFDLKTKTVVYSKPLFTAELNQPITVKPSVATHPNGGKMIYFTTGKIFTEDDLYDVTRQAIYGIWDKGTTPSTHNLLLQTLSESKTHVGQNVRTMTDNAIDWDVHTGWKVPLVDGYRVITNHTLRDGRMQMTLAQPNPDLQENWLLEIKYSNGGAPSKTIFDIDGNGLFEVSDNVDSSPLRTNIAVAWQRNQGVMSGPLLARLSNGIDTKFFNYSKLVTDPVGCTFDCNFLSGHIDVDTDSYVNNGFGDGTANHTHEYDKKINQPFVDYINIGLGGDDFGHVKVTDVTTPTTKFFVAVSNADLSSFSHITIGQHVYNIVEYQKMLHVQLLDLQARGLDILDAEGNSNLFDYNGNPLVFTYDELIANGGTLRNSFDSYTIVLGGLHPTQTGCVKGDINITKGRWRNGALITQLIDANVVKNISQLHQQVPEDLPTTISVDGVDVVLKDGVNIYGGLRAAGTEGSDAPANGYLYESTLFWHYKGSCYGNDNYDQDVQNIRDQITAENAEASMTEEQLLAQEYYTKLQNEYGYINYTELLTYISDVEQYCIDNLIKVDDCEKIKDANGKELKKLKEFIEKTPDFILQTDGVSSENSIDSNSTGGEPTIMEADISSIGITVGPNFIPGRRTWVDISTQ
ncbi:pilus assembly protein [Thalassotalea aquiviva]|uniref:pilus assembly protein n=1 Tax=Thalassotalea aquiviva TaxID=3242415 RepID=UPI00352A688C